MTWASCCTLNAKDYISDRAEKESCSRTKIPPMKMPSHKLLDVHFENCQGPSWAQVLSVITQKREAMSQAKRAQNMTSFINQSQQLALILEVNREPMPSLGPPAHTNKQMHSATPVASEWSSVVGPCKVDCRNPYPVATKAWITKGRPSTWFQSPVLPQTSWMTLGK